MIAGTKGRYIQNDLSVQRLCGDALQLDKNKVDAPCFSPESAPTYLNKHCEYHMITMENNQR